MPGFQEVTDFIKTVGIPAAVAFFVLWRLDRGLASVVTQLAALVTEMRAVNKHNDGVKEHIDQVGRDIIREVDHNTRAAIGPWPSRLPHP
jgi:hypothetical protein